jgi:thymidylate kinase
MPRNASSCKIIVFEGADKLGKSTQAKLLARNINSTFEHAIYVKIPTDTCKSTHSLMYKMLNNGWAKRLPTLFQTLNFLNRLFFQLQVLPIFTEYSDYVVFDRWSLSSVVYGNVTGASRFLTSIFYKILRKPDITVVLYGKPYHRYENDDVYESDDNLQTNVSNGYERWAMTHSNENLFVNVDDKSIRQVNQEIIEALHDRKIW